MRVILDANVYISYLLIPDGAQVPNIVVDAALRGFYTLILPNEVVDELHRKVREKRYLADRIPVAVLEEVIATLSVIAIVTPPSNQEYAPRGRDRKDDYLLAQAIAARGDVIVSGDNDLISIGNVEGIRIVTPAVFARMLDDLAIPQT